MNIAATARTNAETKTDSFDSAEWTERLFALNPWAARWREQLLDPYWGQDLSAEENEEMGGGAYEQDLNGDGDFRLARRQAFLLRRKEELNSGTDGPDYGDQLPTRWNSWAKEMRFLRLEAEEAGHKEKSHLREMLETLAVIDFADTTVPLGLTFELFLFPGLADFTNARFETRTSFRNSRFESKALFSGAQFLAGVAFWETTFAGETTFEGAAFRGGAAEFTAAKFGRANFRSATFTDGTAAFALSKFSGDVAFTDASFDTVAIFTGAQFSGTETSFADAGFSAEVIFNAATFFGSTIFKGANFAKGAVFGGGSDSQTEFRGPADFATATFCGPATFEGSVFRKSANFDDIDSQTAFRLPRVDFHEVPSFIGAKFRGTLRLDNVRTPRYRLLGWTADRDAPARFRELKRLAAAAQDRDREMEFFAQEVRTSRFHASWFALLQGRFWFGLLFELFSNFGRSLWRPALFWFLLVVGFAGFFLSQHDEIKRRHEAFKSSDAWSSAVAHAQTMRSALTNPPTCRMEDRDLFASTNALHEALNLSLANAMVFDGGRSNASRRTYGCLYGFEKVADQEYPIVSSLVSRASTIQSLLSAVLIFLFLLAVRNLLRLK